MVFSIDSPPLIKAQLPAPEISPGDVVLIGGSYPRKVSHVEREPEFGHLVVTFSDGLGVVRWHPSMMIKVITFHDDRG